MNTAAATAAQAGHEPPINFVEQMSNVQAVAHGLIHLWHSSTPSTPHAVSRASVRSHTVPPLACRPRCWPRGQRTYAVSATPIMKTSHATNQDERHPGLRNLIPPLEAVVLPTIGRTPTPRMPRTVSARAIFVQLDFRYRAPFIAW